MHANRFFIRAGHPPAKAQGIRDARAGNACIDGYVVRNTRRSRSHGVPSLVVEPDRRPCALGAGSHVAPRERAALYPRTARLWHHPSRVAGPRQPSPRCALGDGRGGRLCRAIRRHWRNPRRTSSARFHSDQAVGHAGGSIRRPRLPAAQWRPRCAECGPRTLAHNILTVPDTSTRQQSAWNTPMGSGPLPRTHPTTWTMGGAI